MNSMETHHSLQKNMISDRTKREECQNERSTLKKEANFHSRKTIDFS